MSDEATLGLVRLEVDEVEPDECGEVQTAIRYDFLRDRDVARYRARCTEHRDYRPESRASYREARDDLKAHRAQGGE